MTATAPARKLAEPIHTRAGLGARFRAMSNVALTMMLRDRLKLFGTLFGVVFAVVFATFQMGTCLALVDKNETLVANTDCDLWVTPPGVKQLQASTPLTDADLARVRAVDGVAWVAPLLVRGAEVKLPSGGSEAVSLVGTRGPRFAGGPFHLVAGKVDDLATPHAIFFEDAQREKLGGVDLGDEREVNGHSVRVVGFTWGLSPFAPPYAFADEPLAREILRTPPDRHDFLLVGVEPGADRREVQRRIREAVPSDNVMTGEEFQASIRHELLFESQIGFTFGATTFMGLLVGLITVALSMLSSVADNIRIFGTLKALGCTNLDLSALLFVQATLYGAVGSLIGLGFIGATVQGIRNADLTPIVPPQLMGWTAIVMIAVCVVASVLALQRVRKVEPGMVFR
jgi:putative ABC transport system permease protein